MRGLILPVGLRIGWCGYASYHLTHDTFFPIAYQFTLFSLFIVFQILKLRYYLESQNYDDKAHNILHLINYAFLTIVIASYFIEMVSRISDSVSFKEILNHIWIFVLSTGVYCIIELIANFLYCKKISKLKNDDSYQSIISLKGLFQKVFASKKEDLRNHSIESNELKFKVSHTPSISIKDLREKILPISSQKQVNDFIKKNKLKKKNSKKRR